MKPAKTVLLAITLVALTVVILAFAKSARPQNSTLQEAEPGSIDELVVQAIADGNSQVTNALEIEHEDVTSFDEAKTNYTILVARADSQQSLMINPFELSTWFRFTVTETLSVVPPHLCGNNQCGPPSAVAAAGTGEMLVPKSGGTIAKDGVTVSLVPYEFPDFAPGHSYLLFVDYDPSARIGAPALGPIGVFSVDANGNLSAILANSDLKNDIASRFGNSLTQLRAALTSSNPPACNPTSAQNCHNVGGEWDESTCECFRDPCIRKPWLCD
jgi:hypothetical protein